MKRSKLREVIREEIVKALTEDDYDKLDRIYKDAEKKRRKGREQKDREADKHLSNLNRIYQASQQESADDENDDESDNLDFINKLAKKDITLLKPSEYKRYARQTKMPK